LRRVVLRWLTLITCVEVSSCVVSTGTSSRFGGSTSTRSLTIAPAGTLSPALTGLCSALASPVGVHADDLTGLETALLLTFACNDAGDPVTVPKCPGVNLETGNRPIPVFSNERDPVCLFSFRHCCTIREKVRWPKPTGRQPSLLRRRSSYRYWRAPMLRRCHVWELLSGRSNGPRRRFGGFIVKSLSWAYIGVSTFGRTLWPSRLR